MHRLLIFQFQSLIAVGLFTRNDTISGFNRDQLGLFHGGGFYLLGVELLLAVTLIVWAGLMTFIITGVSAYTFKITYKFPYIYGSIIYIGRMYIYNSEASSIDCRSFMPI